MSRLLGFATVSGALCVGSIAAAQPVPPDEGAFINVVTAAQAAFKSAPNEMAAGGVRVRRRDGVCAVVPSRKATDWIGTIKKLAAANDGRGVLEISVAKGVTIATTNNSFSDKYYKSLIDPGSAVYGAAIAMKVGDRVIFSGSFFPDEGDCFKEQSLSLTGSLEAPTYTMHFVSLRKALPPVEFRDWKTSADTYKGQTGCHFTAEFTRGLDPVLIVGYSTVRRTFAIYGIGVAKSAGVAVDSMPRVPLTDCKEGSCIAESSAVQSRILAQMKGGKVAHIDFTAETGEPLGPLPLPIERFAELINMPNCQPRPE